MDDRERRRRKAAGTRPHFCAAPLFANEDEEDHHRIEKQRETNQGQSNGEQHTRGSEASNGEDEEDVKRRVIKS